MNELTHKSRQLRKDSTKQERKLWYYLRKRQIDDNRFRRQYPIGEYIVDFVCIKKRLIIEVDGGQHNEKDNIEYDKLRTEFLEKRGFRVLRFWNCDIDNNIDGVYETILEYLN